MSRPLRVHEVLSRDELDQLEAFAREPGRTVDEIHQWLLERQFNVSRTAAWNWKTAFDEQVMRERFSRSGELARAMKTAVKDGSFEDVADAAVMQLTQVVFEQAAKLESDGQIDPQDVQAMTRSLVNLGAMKAGLTKMLAEKFQTEMQARTAKGGTGITADDIADARRAIFGS